MNLDQLRITEIFYSLQGESNKVGIPTVFVRLTGCPLRCNYCDTAYAFSGGKMLHHDDIIEKIKTYKSRHVCITGGEPLAQQNCISFLKKLADNGYLISIETSGERDISKVDKRIMIIMDLKTPDSGESEKNRYTNINFLKPTDQIKFVICSRDDYVWSINIMNEFNLTNCCEVLFSPSHNQQNPQELANWILEDKLSVRFQMQLHKILWDNEPGR